MQNNLKQQIQAFTSKLKRSLAELPERFGRTNEEGKQTDLIFGSFFPTFAEKGMYADLLAFFKTDRMATDDLYESLTKMATTTKDNLIGIPMSPTPLAVYYNKEWLDKAGISYPSGDWTWEQYFDLSIKLKSANAVANKEVYGSTIPFELTFF